jgi:hypothetical protein
MLSIDYSAAQAGALNADRPDVSGDDTPLLETTCAPGSPCQEPGAFLLPPLRLGQLLADLGSLEHWTRVRL